MVGVKTKLISVAEGLTRINVKIKADKEKKKIVIPKEKRK